MTYQKLKDGYIRRMSDGALIPENENNQDYQEYLADKEKVVEVVDVSVMQPPPSKEELAKREAVAQKKAAIRELELKSLRKLFDGESLTAVNAERAKLRGEINQLEGV